MSKRGFTLIEVLVAMTVLAVGLLAVAKMSVVAVRANTHSRQVSDGYVLAQNKMEELRRFATAQRPGTQSTFDFDYLISTAPTYTSVVDPPDKLPKVDTLIPGFLAGTAPVTTPGGTIYTVCYDDGTHGDKTGGDKIYSNSGTDTPIGSGFPINWLWTVQPITLGAGAAAHTDYAKLVVETSWTDRYNKTRTVHLESLAQRRQ